MKPRSLVVSVLCAVCMFQIASAQEKKAAPVAKIDDVAWIAGHWSGEAMGGSFEETWNPPMSGAMMGMFKFVQNGSIGFYEILTIVPQDESLVLRLKHFHADLKGWEEKNDSVEFPLVEVTENEVRFDGLVFQRISDNEMNIRVMVKQGEGEPEELLFVCKRNQKADQ